MQAEVEQRRNVVSIPVDPWISDTVTGFGQIRLGQAADNITLPSDQEMLETPNSMLPWTVLEAQNLPISV